MSRHVNVMWCQVMSCHVSCNAMSCVVQVVSCIVFFVLYLYCTVLHCITLRLLAIANLDTMWLHYLHNKYVDWWCIFKNGTWYVFNGHVAALCSPGRDFPCFCLRPRMISHTFCPQCGVAFAYLDCNWEQDKWGKPVWYCASAELLNITKPKVMKLSGWKSLSWEWSSFALFGGSCASNRNARPPDLWRFLQCNTTYSRQHMCIQTWKYYTYINASAANLMQTILKGSSASLCSTGNKTPGTASKGCLVSLTVPSEWLVDF